MIIKTQKTIVYTEYFEIDPKVYKEIVKKYKGDETRIQWEIENYGKNIDVIMEGVDMFHGYEVEK